MTDVPIRVAELFCGIGGCASACRQVNASVLPLSPLLQVVAAVDIDQSAGTVYRRNFLHDARDQGKLAQNTSAGELPPRNRVVLNRAGHARQVITSIRPPSSADNFVDVRTASVESIALSTWHAWRADLWWISAPCQPFTTRGKQRDELDPRATIWPTLLDRLGTLLPVHVICENVPGFATSRVRDQLVRCLEGHEYGIQELLCCPTELGVPNRRRRHYLLGSRLATPNVQLPPKSPRRLRAYLAEAEITEAELADLQVATDVILNYWNSLDRVDDNQEEAITSCFTAAYGRSPIRSGSYLQTATGLRRFHPREIAALLGFPPTFSFPSDVSRRRRWKLLGNSISVTVASALLRGLLSSMRKY